MPAVSIVVATFNRSAVLRHALAAVRDQTLQDWEAIVVGDACTDDTGTVVEGLGDPRFRFVNLRKNHGEQSVPNNEGMRLARAPVVALLNHDDLWRRDHLERAVARLDASNSDLVYGWTANLLPDGTVVLLGASPGGCYSPALVVPASSWVFRRELVERVGMWRSGWTLRLSPSQEWLWRAHRAGRTLTELPRLSVVGFPSGSRPGSYAANQADEQGEWRARMSNNPDWAEGVLATYVRGMAAGGRLPVPDRPVGQLSWALKNAAAVTLAGLSMHPLALRLAMTNPRRGGFLRRLRRIRGLPPPDRPGP